MKRSTQDGSEEFHPKRGRHVEISSNCDVLPAVLERAFWSHARLVQFQVEEWANHWDGFKEPHSIYYHESPGYWASTVFLRSVPEIAEDGRRRIERELHRRLWMIERQFYLGEVVDWEAEKAEINAIIRP